MSAQIAAFAFLLGLSLLALRRFRFAVLALGLSMGLAISVYAGYEHLRNALITLLDQQLPILLPFAFLVWSIRTHQTDLTWLLGIAVAARVRRGFEYTEWYAFLLELPIYALILYRMKVKRAIPLLGGALAIVGWAAYWEFAKGPLTGGYRYEHRQWVRTARGPVRWSVEDARLYSALKSAIGDDPAPLYSLNYTGGFNYYLGRHNPSPSGETITLAGRDKLEVANMIRAARPLLLERRDPYGVRIQTGTSLTSWKLLTSPNYVETEERPDFRIISAECEKSAVEHAVPDTGSIAAAEIAYRL